MEPPPVLSASVRALNRRAIGLGLTLALSVFMFVSALHALHPVAGPNQTDPCRIASVSAHTAGTAAERDALGQPIAPAQEGLIETAPAAPVARPIPPRPGRAPPSPTA